jgi:hypothetical protein
MRTVLFIALYYFFTVGTVLAQDGSVTGTIPAELHRPQRGEAVRYPQDIVIGQLGRGTAPAAAYTTAQELLSALLTATPDTAVLTPLKDRQNGTFLDTVQTDLQAINVRNVHIGGGQEEADGCISFLFRFIGSDQWIAGELYLMPGDESWYCDDIVFDRAQAIVIEDPSAKNDGFF